MEKRHEKQLSRADNIPRWKKKREILWKVFISCENTQKQLRLSMFFLEKYHNTYKIIHTLQSYIHLLKIYFILDFLRYIYIFLLFLHFRLLYFLNSLSCLFYNANNVCINVLCDEYYSFILSSRIKEFSFLIHLTMFPITWTSCFFWQY